jgi:hypothetical protein
MNAIDGPQMDSNGISAVEMTAAMRLKIAGLIEAFCESVEVTERPELACHHLAELKGLLIDWAKVPAL